MTTLDLLFIILGYLIGSIPFGYIFGKLFKGIDVRKYGTKNSGATNVFKTIGPLAGILTGILDIGKGSFVVFIAEYFVSLPVAIAAGIMAILGHMFPVYLKFRGGRGLATTIGVLLIVALNEIALVGVLYIILLLITRKMNLSGLIAIIFLPVFSFLFNRSSEIIIGVSIIAAMRWLFNLDKIKQIIKEPKMKLKSRFKNRKI